MKIDLSVAVTKEILNSITGLTSSGQIPDASKFGHIGTHFDVMGKNFSLDNTERRGILFDVSHIKGRDIGTGDIDIDKVTENDFVIFHTGCLKEKGYGNPEYFQDHPELSDVLITALVNKRVSMIGIDAASIRMGAGHRRADEYCAVNGVFVVENLANLEILLAACRGKPFTAHTYPVNFESLTGLPCRVVAEV